jgi:antitoxin component of MazEF toxin-antitoxin module
MAQKMYSRSVQDLGNGCRGVSLPNDMARWFNVEIGDKLLYRMSHEESRVTYFLTRDVGEFDMTRIVQNLGSECRGVSLPGGMADDFSVRIGDEVRMEIERERDAVSYFLG